MWRTTLRLALQNLRRLRSRPGGALVMAFGVGAVVAVFVGLLSTSAGFSRALADSGRPGRAILLRDGTVDELTSWLSAEQLGVLAEYDGIERASGELYVSLDLVDAASGELASGVGRGVEDEAFALRPELTIATGRAPEAGRNEIVAGLGAARRFSGLDVGAQLDVRGTPFVVVGHFDAEGTAPESELWFGLRSLQSAFRRPWLNSARVRVGGDLDALAEQLRRDPRLELALIDEADFYAEQSAGRAALVGLFATVIVSLMAIGGITAVLNTMFSALDTRTTEIASLQALGFPALPIAAAVFIEVAVIALAGSALGAGAAYAWLDGLPAAALAGTSLAQVVYELSVPPSLWLSGILLGVALALTGAIWPTLAAVRSPIVAALRGR